MLTLVKYNICSIGINVGTFVDQLLPHSEFVLIFGGFFLTHKVTSGKSKWPSVFLYLPDLDICYIPCSDAPTL